MMLRELRTRAAQAPSWTWFAFAAIGCVAILVWHEWANSKDPDDSWLDPEQPAAQVSATPETVPKQRARARPYPGSLMSWGCSAVGDC